MAVDILMPKVFPDMQEGSIGNWVKQEGDQIKIGDVILEIETDKAVMEYEATDEGILGKILVEAGSGMIAVETPVGVILQNGESADSVSSTSAPSSTSEPEPVSESTEAKAVAVPEQTEKGERILASPLARRLAGEAGIELSTLSGSGPNGRIVKLDIEAAKSVKSALVEAEVVETAPEVSAAATPAGTVEAEYIDIPHSPMRKAIASRMVQAKAEAPHAYITVDVMLDNVLALRKQLNDQAEQMGLEQKLTVNDFVVKAASLALMKYPQVNACWTDKAIRQYKNTDICVAVATPTGLITPIVSAVNQKGLAEISSDVKKLAEKAQTGSLHPSEFQGGTFTVSNLGMFGVKQFSAIVNPPQASILAFAAGEKRPVVVDDEIVIRTVATCTFSGDHRVVDGALGAQFAAAFKQILENPLSLML
jgi:pyruvate dehydrogenase E2 component (dihydrolipoyllysine-residue acetyltransferase)